MQEKKGFEKRRRRGFQSLRFSSLEDRMKMGEINLEGFIKLRKYLGIRLAMMAKD